MLYCLYKLIHKKSVSFVDIGSEISHYSGATQHLTVDHFIFKKCFNIASNTDEHIHFYLNYLTVGYLTMCFYVFRRLLSLKHFK